MEGRKLWAIPLLLVGLIALYVVGRGLYNIIYNLTNQAPLAGEKDLRTEIELLRKLAASGDGNALAEMLGRSTAQVPAGEFLMGDDAGPENERPQRSVYLDAFEMDRYEITNTQYQRFLQATGRTPPPYWSGGQYPARQADYPVVGVSWTDANDYCAWAGKRLPTEAEWEKACRGTDSRIYPWGSQWDARRANAVVSEDVSRPTAWALLQATPAGAGVGLRPVGSYPNGASPYGAMDMAGNASEWVADWYNWEGYAKLPNRSPLNLEPPWNRCVRGSSWRSYGSADDAQTLSRCSARDSSHVSWNPRIGFRCARNS